MNAHSRSEPSLTPPDDGPRPPNPGPRLPVQIGRYLILDRLGAGGMGTVYKAYDPQLDRVVALKMPHLNADAEDSTVPTQRFLREARTAAQIDHPHVCRIHDVAEDNGRPYAVMAYVEGQSLAHRLRGGRRYDDPVEAARLVRQVADALDAVHAHGLLHRDLKTANILLDCDGRAILTDFGLARPRLDAERLTADGAILGTPAFMAPEQAAGRTDRIGPATDVYGLGVVFYRMLTGRLPFQGHAVTVLWKIGNEIPPAPSRLRADLDPDLEAIVLRSMAPRPEDRYASAREMSAALERWLAGGRETPRASAVPPAAAADAAGTSTVANPAEATLVDPTPPLPVRVSSEQTIDLPAEQSPARGGKPLRGKSRAFVIAAALGAVLVGGLLASLALSRSWGRRDGAEQQEPPARVVIPAEPLSWSARAPLGGKSLVSRPAALAGVLSWTVETRSPRGPLRALACSPDGTVLAIAGDDGMVRLWRAGSDHLLRVLVGHAAGVSSVAWSPDGRYLASAGEDATIRLWDADTGQPLRILRGHTAAVVSVAWSPDGARLASAGRDTKVRLWDVRDGRQLPVTLSHPHEVLRVAWSPDGKKLASAGMDVAIHLWDASGNLLHELQKDTFPYVFDLAWSSDGKVLASAGGDCRLRLWDGATGRLLSEVPTDPPVLALAWSRRGNRLATAALRAVQTWDAAGRLVQTIPKEEDVVHAICWSGDGKTLMTGGDGALRSYDVTAGKAAGVRPVHPAGSAAVAWSPRGGELAVCGFGDGAVRLWAADRARVELLKGRFSPVAAWSPDGGRLAVAGADHAVRIWEAAGQRWLPPLRRHTKTITSLAWSRDSKLLASGSEDGTARLWAIPEGKLRQTLHSRETSVYSVAWSPNGARLALGVSPGAVQIWEVGKENPLVVREEPTALVRAVAWSPNGRLLASAANEPVGLVLLRNDLPAGLRPLQAAKKDGAYALAWSSDSQWLATGASGGLIRFLAAHAGESQLELQAHDGPVTALSRSAAGDILASAGSDGLVRLWIGAFVGSGPRKPEPGPVLVPLAADGSLIVSSEGHWAGSPLAERQLVYVVLTDDGQQVLSPQEFYSAHDWKNRPARAIPAGK
jgi:WD40 repeat protein